MKNLRNCAALLLTLGLGASLTACKDPLNIQPQQSVDASTALSTSTKVGSAVVGIYAKLDDPALYGTNLVLLPELIGGDGYVSWQGTFQSYREVSRRTLIRTNTEAERTWARAYEGINQCNLVLEALPVVADTALKSQYAGEARFVRGALYFELVRLYAQQYRTSDAATQPGVPLALVANRTVGQVDAPLPRATVAAVYNQVLADLRTAAVRLPVDNGTRATRYAAKAMLARVYLQQGNYVAARAAADEVITRSGKALAATLASVFSNKNSAESLFEIQQNDQNNAGTSNDGLATFFASDGGTGRGDVRVLSNFSSRYEPNDARGEDTVSAGQTKKLIYVGNGNRPGFLRSIKWRQYGQNIPIIRLAEMYLIRAEADVRANNTTSALADVNLIRARSGASPLTTITLQDVLNERQLELAFEGFHIHDLKRTGTNIVVNATTTLPITAAKLVLPIPQHDINVDPSLTQNTGY